MSVTSRAEHVLTDNSPLHSCFWKLISMRRIILGLVACLLAFYLSIMFFREEKRAPVVRSTTTGEWNSADKRIAYRHDIFPSEGEATEHFNSQLQEAQKYQELTPCLDSNGQRIGNRAVILQAPSRAPETWQIIWTRQARDFSETFSIQSASLADARYFETVERAGWERCLPGR